VQAVTVIPGTAGSATLAEVPEPRNDAGAVLVEALAVGVCGTDAEIANGRYGWAPPGEERLILGHESLGRVAEAPAGSGFAAGDLVVGVVR
jgi:threonine dehydrogenase-like Zn-dependent dehydrogenase